MGVVVWLSDYIFQAVKLSSFLKNEGCRFRNLSFAVNYNEIEMEFPLAGWVSSHKVNFIWKLLGELLKRVIKQLSNTDGIFCNNTGEKWGIENKLIFAPWKWVMWLVFSKLGIWPSYGFTACLCTFLYFLSVFHLFLQLESVKPGNILPKQMKYAHEIVHVFRMTSFSHDFYLFRGREKELVLLQSLLSLLYFFNLWNFL